jgi:hypothetical protein
VPFRGKGKINFVMWFWLHNFVGMKTCRTCGESKSIDFFSKRSVSTDGYNTRCKTCENSINKKWRDQHPEKMKEHFEKAKLNGNYKYCPRILDNIKKWKAKNNEKVKETKKRSERNNPIKFKEKKKRSKAARRKNITDGYVKSILKIRGFSSEHITPEIIEVQRLIVKTKRLCKTLQN